MKLRFKSDLKESPNMLIFCIAHKLHNKNSINRAIGTVSANVCYEILIKIYGILKSFDRSDFNRLFLVDS